MKKAQLKKIKCSVRFFAQPLARTGHISNDGREGLSSLELGNVAHSKLQSMRLQKIENYICEKSIGHDFNCDGYSVRISGRIDGFFSKGKEVTIEEIKTTFSLKALVEKLEKTQDHPYQFQLKTYIYLYYKNHGIVPKARLVIGQIGDSSCVVDDLSINFEELETWFEKRLQQIVAEEKRLRRIIKKRKKIAATLNFPFEKPRSGQKELIDFCTKQLTRKSCTMIQAPTGLGKTIGVLFPSLANALVRGSQVIYLTPKNSQFRAVQESVQILNKNRSGSKLKLLVLTAKSKSCLNDHIQCDYRHCSYAENYYDKLADHELVEKTRRKKELTYDVLKKQAELHKICPHFLREELLHDADVIVGDYHHLFSSQGFLSSHVVNMDKKNLPVNLVVDEAHNLPQRGSDNYSCEIDLLELKRLVNLLRDGASESSKIRSKYLKILDEIEFGFDEMFLPFQKLSREYLRIERNSKESEFRSVVEKINFLYKKTIQLFLVSVGLEKTNAIDPENPMQSLMFLLSDFNEKVENLSAACFLYFRKMQEGCALGFYCIEPSHFFRPLFKNIYNGIFFSATLKPFGFYKNVIGLPDDVAFQEFESSFPKSNRKILAIPQISTAYRDRSHHYSRIADTVVKISSKRNGHYFVFFPSYHFLNQVKTELSHFRDIIGITVQDGNLQKLSSLREQISRETTFPQIILAVQGGVLSEGIDIPSPYLHGVFIVGPAIPQISFLREESKKYFQANYDDDGFTCAYIYPAMAKSIQSAGRVIRSENKKGLIVLFDRRFLQEEYSRSMPKAWFEDSPNELNRTGILKEIERFWESG